MKRLITAGIILALLATPVMAVGESGRLGIKRTYPYLFKIVSPDTKWRIEATYTDTAMYSYDIAFAFSTSTTQWDWTGNKNWITGYYADCTNLYGTAPSSNLGSSFFTVTAGGSLKYCIQLTIPSGETLGTYYLNIKTVDIRGNTIVQSSEVIDVKAPSGTLGVLIVQIVHIVASILSGAYGVYQLVV